MASVFVSHSAEDQEGKAFLQALFGSVGHKAFFYSWEGPVAPHSDTLRSKISNADSLFLLLSPHIENNFTIAWVACEVGMALALSKPVWVLERLIGRGARIAKVPVPGLTGYIERPSKLPNLRAQPYFSLVEQAGLGVPVGPDGQEIQKTSCPNQKCRAPYYVYFEGPRLICPACRTAITLK